MSTISHSEQAGDVSPWLVVRVTGKHYVNSARILTDTMQVDLITAVVFLTVSQFNLNQILDEPDIAMRYSGIGETPPDEQREPVSAYGLAQRLALPYETVRRHANKLVELGHCVRAPGGGLVVSRDFIASPLARKMAERTMTIMAGYVAALAACGMNTSRIGPLLPEVANHVSRLNARHFLSLMNNLNKHMQLDLFSGLILIAIITANTRTPRSPERWAEEFDAQDIGDPGAIRRPVSVYAIAKGLNLPYETARRYVNQLIDLGYCQRAAQGGVIAPHQTPKFASFEAATMASLASTEAFLSSLASIASPSGSQGSGVLG